MYASKRHFGKHRATQGTTVILKENGKTFPGIIFDIKDNDLPAIITYGAAGKFEFFDAQTEDDLKQMPNGSWTWPPVVAQKGFTEMDRITIDPNVCGGQPCIRGIRIPVSLVLKHLAAGQSADQIIAEFPDLEHADIPACLHYAAENLA